MLMTRPNRSVDPQQDGWVGTARLPNGLLLHSPSAHSAAEARLKLAECDGGVLPWQESIAAAMKIERLLKGITALLATDRFAAGTSPRCYGLLRDMICGEIEAIKTEDGEELSNGPAVYVMAKRMFAELHESICDMERVRLALEELSADPHSSALRAHAYWAEIQELYGEAAQAIVIRAMALRAFELLSFTSEPADPVTGADRISVGGVTGVSADWARLSARAFTLSDEALIWFTACNSVTAEQQLSLFADMAVAHRAHLDAA